MKKYMKYIINEENFIALLISMTFLIFGPIEMYYVNDDLNSRFAISSVIVRFIVIAIVVMLLITLILLVAKKNNYVSKILNSIFFAIGVLLYLQGNYINVDYGVLNGAEIDWTSYKLYGIVDTCFWIIVIIVSIVVSLKLDGKIIKKVHLTISSFIIAIELITLVVLIITASNNKGIQTVKITDEEQFTLGSDGNVVILLLDTFDGAVFDELLEDDVLDIKQQFSDFTYYDNMAGGFPFTGSSIPLILSGEWYDKTSTYKEFINNAYMKTDLYKTLYENGYSIGLYGDPTMYGKSLEEYTRNIVSGKGDIVSGIKPIEKFYKITAFRYFPHILKKYTEYQDYSFSEYYADGIYKFEEDIDFYEKLVDESITLKSGNAFVFYHLKGIHSPYTIDENVTESSDSDERQQALGELKIVERYIAEMKEKGVYDNSTIIVMADHGYKGMGQCPIFLVKEAYANHELMYNSAPVSYDDLQGTFYCLTMGESNGMSSIYDFQEGDYRERYFRYCSVADLLNQDVPFAEYLVGDNVKDLENIKKTGTLYGRNGTYQSEYLKYSDGMDIDFGEDGNYEEALDSGYRNFGGYIYSYGTYTNMKIDMMDYRTGGVKFSIGLANVLDSPQRLQLYVNNNYVGECVAYSGGDLLSYVVPEEYLNQGITEFKITYPDAITQSDVVVEGHTAEGLSVVYDYINISLLDQVKKGNKYTFGKGGNAENIIGSGISQNEEGYGWSIGDESIFYWVIDDMVSDISIDVTLKSFIDENQVLKVYMNDDFVQEIDVTQNDFTISIPREYIVDGVNVMRIEYPNAISPREINGSDDDRKLSVAYEIMEIN
jgi:hypothetical protein